VIAAKRQLFSYIMHRTCCTRWDDDDDVRFVLYQRA